MNTTLGHTNLRRQSSKSTINRIKRYKYMYMFLIPAAAFYLTFSYIPMAGITLAFKEFQFNKSWFEMPWVGLRYFNQLFSNVEFWRAFKNTLIISFGRLALEFPIPIILALLLNEVRGNKTKRFFQTVYTFPHFLSWILVIGILNGIFSNDGLINQALIVSHHETIQFLTSPKPFLAIIFGSSIWKGAGWGSIIYLAALAGIDPELYAAAAVDGANRWHCLKHITWPGLKSTVVILLILQCGGILNGGFDQILNMYNPAVYQVADIIDTYIYRQAFTVGMNFSYNTAVGLFKSVIGFGLVLTVNKLAERLGEEGLF